MTERIWSDSALMKLHADALFTHDARGRMVSINEPDGAPAPRLFLGRTAEGNVFRVRQDVPEAVVSELAALCNGEPPLEPGSERPHCGVAIIELLERYAPVQAVWRGPAFELVALNASPVAAKHRLMDSPTNSFGGEEWKIQALTRADVDLLSLFPDWLDELRSGLRQPWYAAVQHRQAVAICASVRITATAYAAGVETLPEHRGRGFARQVVNAWARAVRAGGATPMYSTSFTNLASRAVAKALGAHMFGVDFHVT